MSIKNQSRLTIFASVIIGVTVLALFGLYFLVEKISLTKTPQMTMQMPPPGPPPGLEDGMKAKAKGQRATSDSFDDAVPPPRKAKADAAPSPARRVSNGKNDAAMEQKQPNMNAPRGGMPMQGMPPGMPPHMQNGYYPGGPPPFPPNVDPQQRAFYEQEMERQRQMMMQGPPEGYPPYPYYPGGPPPMDYEDSYDRGPYGGPDDYYDYDYDSKNETAKENDTNFAQAKPKPVELANQGRAEEAFDEEHGPDDFFEDDYLNEFFDEEL